MLDFKDFFVKTAWCPKWIMSIEVQLHHDDLKAKRHGLKVGLDTKNGFLKKNKKIEKNDV